jgi:hypothetical protein
MRLEGQLKIHEHVMLGSSTPLTRKRLTQYYLPPEAAEPEKERALRKLFADLEIPPDEDIVHEYNGYADAMRDLLYPIGNDVSRATMIIQRLLREVYGIREAGGLNFTLEA